MDDAEAWVPDACTLPTADRPFRVAEFDDLLAGVVRHRPERTRLVLELEPRPLLVLHVRADGDRWSAEPRDLGAAVAGRGAGRAGDEVRG
ncbi:hypothetical protein [Lentzea sp. HUAS12]|uniref:hypothetical protein n=1 Tax=Lentzea sp. HUAS12 TaxID=2951806 RepID=UPI00209E463F|nr:hypothetical protein [Lentzea sp. HUAS12]USX54893.1 hypothetical protein ND450_12535 [Lentzea sp. HUAS12]